MAAGHLITNLQLTFDGDKDLDHFNDARRKLIAATQLFDLGFELVFDQLDLRRRAFNNAPELRFHGFVIDPNLAPIGHRQLIDVLLGKLLPFVEQHLAAIVTQPPRQAPPHQQLFEPP